MHSPKEFVALSVAGGMLLWGVMMVNGTLDGISAVAQTGSFPDGRLLRTVYTGFPLVDEGFSKVVVFFDLLCNTQADAPKWLFFHLCNLVGAMDTWVLIESRRRGVRNLFLRHTIIFIFLWNLAGAAFITPIYFYLICRSGHTTRDPTIPLNEARGFPPTVVANALFPLLLFVPALDNWHPYDHQGSIGLYHLSPMLMIITVVLCSRPGTSLTVFESPKDLKAPNKDAPWVVGSLLATGLISAAVHLYIVSKVLTSADVTLSQLFWPSLERVFTASRGSYEALLEGAHLFTQLDAWVVSVACIVFTNHLLQKATPTKSRNTMQDVWKNILGTLCLGPGAAGSFALAIREGRLRDATYI
ncbi:hypothetical protein B0I35DRAFT_490169 [Stachybotrys elegans]|uniref:Uncharacterized protein n=1 Tax=Stachybotrys elegans TaxID=80388 RepID=A0A8K0SK16_9HYPO|nr:hypothetical protein B0I35DRAFT_490169 [Stachybotrys elegans]